MTIDINKLRRLAQAATPGPWYATGKLTRYVEARIDGGLIQEVAACGPTKADGGYGPQQEAIASLIAAANPATISELLDRLEAAEKERDALRAAVRHEADCVEACKSEIDALRAKIETAENDAAHQKALADSALRVAEGWERKCGELRAKIAEMERQEPLWFIDERGEPQRYHKSKADYCKYGGLDLLYALPGAKGETK